MDVMGVRSFSQGETKMFTREQFTLVAEQHMDMIFRIAFSYLRSREDADDVTQNVLLALYRTDKAFRDGDHLKAWLIRVTINACRKILRSPWRRRNAPLEEYAGAMPFQEARDSDLFLAIMALDVKYRSVIVLYYYEGYDIAEIGNLLGIPVGTVGTRLARARNMLKSTLAEASI